MFYFGHFVRRDSNLFFKTFAMQFIYLTGIDRKCKYEIEENCMRSHGMWQLQRGMDELCAENSDCNESSQWMAKEICRSTITNRGSLINDCWFIVIRRYFDLRAVKIHADFRFWFWLPVRFAMAVWAAMPQFVLPVNLLL